MTKKELVYLFRNVNRYKRMIKNLQEKVEILETQATKITPSYSEEGGGGSFNSSSKVENNAVKIHDIEKQIEDLQFMVDTAEKYLDGMKSHQRFLIKQVYVYHLPMEKVAEKEKTTLGNVKKIISVALNKISE